MEEPKEKSLDMSSGQNGYSDYEHQHEHGEIKTVPLKRKLQSRHLQMIAIGGTIGTGLFIGSGGALATSGPAGTLIAYAFVGTLVYSVMVALGEMATYIPVSACGLIIQYWAPGLNIGIFIGVFWIVITVLNFLPVNFYGETEFWLCTIKIMTIIGFMIFGICINAGAGQQGYIGFKYWHEPGAFAPSLLEQVNNDVPLAKFVGFWSVLIQAGFSYQGTELVGIAAGETDNPRKTVPAAIRKTFYRILFFFVLTVFFIGILIPYTNEDLLSEDTDATSSPFVIAAKLAGVDALPGIINFVLLTVVLSAANSNVYSGSRILVGLAQEGSAPKLFTRVTKGGVPYVAVTFTTAFGLLGFMNESSNGGQVFDWFLNISAVAGFIAWTCINIAHICFMRALRARGQSRDTLPYKAFWQPWFSWYGIFFNVLIILTQGFTSFMPWNTTDFFVAYISLMLFAVLYIGHKVILRQPFVRPAEADLDSGRREIEDTIFDEAVPTTIWGKFWYWVG
ncbi:lysine permease [Vermiconidia calcicola]|uniref:Lysine permease n=1 Tax=Vermiconidia calcicola TaxID=1690605 RepID=A0ACC3N409_9PEZI|nr:lysine permease [Vermiconidia calcicola]